MKKINILKTITILFAFVLLCGCHSKDYNNTTTIERDKNASKINESHLKNNELRWEWIVEPGKYEDLFYVNDDRIAVKTNKGKYILINIEGESVNSNEYDSISKFCEGVALVNINDNFSYIDKNGLFINKDTYQDGYSFSESLGAIKLNNTWGFIDLSGKVIIECQFKEVKPFFENYAAVKVDKKWGFINKSGKMQINPQFDQVRDFREGNSAVKLTDKWGFINCEGSKITNFEYDEVKDFHEGYAAVMKNNKWGFINKSGEVCIDLKYDDVGKFSEGKASVKLVNYYEGMDAWAYIDRNDNVVIDFYPYDASEGRMVWVGEFKDGMAFVSKTLYCIIDTKGNDIFFGGSKFFISSLTYNMEFDAIPGYIFTDDEMTNRKYGLMGLRGNQRLEPVFDYVEEIKGSYVIVGNMIDGEYKKGIIELFNE